MGITDGHVELILDYCRLSECWCKSSDPDHASDLNLRLIQQHVETATSQRELGM